MRHNKEGHTRLVLTHPMSGCLYYMINVLYSVDLSSELEYNSGYVESCTWFDFMGRVSPVEKKVYVVSP